MNLEWLKTFRVIFECKTITEASKQLQMTQPGVSKHLSALEKHIGKTLFNRNTRKLRPTQDGINLYKQINKPLEALANINFTGQVKEEQDPLSIRIGCTSDYFSHNLKQTIYTYDMGIEIQFGNQNQLIHALDMGSVQALVGVKQYHAFNHQFIFLNQEEFVLVGSKGIVLPKEVKENNNLLSDWLENQTWVVYDNIQDEIQAFWELNFNSGVSLNPKHILPSHSGIVNVLQHHSGISLLPKHIAKQAIEEHKIQEIALGLKPYKQELYLATTVKYADSVEVKTFKERLGILEKP